MKTTRLAVVLVAFSVFVGASASSAKDAAKGPVKTKTSDGQVITKNPDGTVEVSDSDSAAPAESIAAPVNNSPTAKPGVTYKAAPPATIRYGDGVVVRRNPDGSVDVCDEDEAHPVYHSFGPAPARARHVTKRGGTHPVTAKAPVKKAK
jgi:hypothetical protein